MRGRPRALLIIVPDRGPDARVILALFSSDTPAISPSFVLLSALPR
jgi:hypothetical protein